MNNPEQILKTITKGNLYYDNPPPEDKDLPDDSPYFGAYKKWREIHEFIDKNCRVITDDLSELNLVKMEFLAADESCELFSYEADGLINQDHLSPDWVELMKGDKYKKGFVWVPKDNWTDNQFIAACDAASCPICPDWNPDEIWREKKS